MTENHLHSTWEPGQYLKFGAERQQPALDLLGLVEPRDAMDVLDLGCGPGNLTALLAQRLPNSHVLGVDRSDTMLEQAQKLASDRVRFVEDEISSYLGAEDTAYDLIYSNAALHWIADHGAVLAQIRQRLRPGGQIAIQMPANFEQPSHTLAATLAAEPRYAADLGGRTSGAAVESLEFYARTLHGLGFARQQVRHHLYLHLLANRDAAFEWVRGSMLWWYRAELPDDRYQAFESEYRTRLLAVLEDERPLRFTYRRVLLWAAL